MQIAKLKDIKYKGAWWYPQEVTKPLPCLTRATEGGYEVTVILLSLTQEESEALMLSDAVGDAFTRDSAHFVAFVKDDSDITFSDQDSKALTAPVDLQSINSTRQFVRDAILHNNGEGLGFHDEPQVDIWGVRINREVYWTYNGKQITPSHFVD